MDGRRIDHVVVLMLENRSFDHLLGFLDHPSEAFPHLAEGAYSNPENPADPHSPQVAVTSDGDHLLPLDPPHSHRSAMEQLGLRATGRARMNGFVAAYARKAMGQEERPVVHWWRLEALVLAVAAAVAALTARLRPARRLWPLAFTAVAAPLSWALHRWRRSVNSVPVVPGVGPQVMRCLAPHKLPVLATLARQFAVCTRWHCSVPGETWPNRNFVHAATSDGAVDIEIGFYEAPTVFELLERSGADWHVYTDGRAHLWAFKDLWLGDRIANWYGVDELAGHVQGGRLPAYSFIEPRHTGPGSNSQHPGNNVRAGPSGSDFERAEQLIATVYEALRQRPEVFAKTLLLVTYDEHGGLFDHQPPPRRVPAPAPLRRSTTTLSRRLVSWFIERAVARFDFRMLGPRVPAVVVSPWIEAGTVDAEIRDHTSVIATVRALLAPESRPLTRRDRWASGVEHLAQVRSSPRAPEDLPDLSHLAGRPGADAVAPAGAAPTAPDLFAEQLDEVAQRVRVELDRMGAPAPPPGTGGAPSLGGAAGGPDGDVVARFRAAAEARRAALSP